MVNNCICKKRWLLLLQNIKKLGWETKKINRWEKVWHVVKILPIKGNQMRYLWLLLHSNNCMCTTKTFYQFIGLCLWFTIVLYKTILCVFVFIEQFCISSATTVSAFPPDLWYIQLWFQNIVTNMSSLWKRTIHRTHFSRNYLKSKKDFL